MIVLTERLDNYGSKEIKDDQTTKKWEKFAY